MFAQRLVPGKGFGHYPFRRKCLAKIYFVTVAAEDMLPEQFYRGYIFATGKRWLECIYPLVPEVIARSSALYIFKYLPMVISKRSYADHFLFQLHDHLRHKKKQVGEPDPVGVSRGQTLCFVFEIITQVTKKPVGLLIRKFQEPVKSISRRRPDISEAPCSKYTFQKMMREIVFVIIEETTGIETVSPVQQL